MLTRMPFSDFFFLSFSPEEHQGRPTLTLGEELRLRKVGEALKALHKLMGDGRVFICMNQTSRLVRLFMLKHFTEQMNQIY